MLKKRFLLIALLLSALIAYLHIKALEMNLYFVYPWFDVALHFLGGALISVIALTVFLYAKGEKNFLENKKLLFLTPAIAVLVGALWEVFELWAGVVPSENYVFDTSIDLVMDLIGGVLVSSLILGAKEDKEIRKEIKN